MASPTPTYDALEVDHRLGIERLLFERRTGVPYAERSIADDASDKKREYLVSCIRDANHRVHEGPIPQHQINAVREFSARATLAAGAVQLVTLDDLRERINAAQLEAVANAPFDLDALEQEARRAAIEQDDPAKPIPRRRIAEKALTKLGYAYGKEQTGPGTLAFTKTTADGAAWSCNFDFGSWRRTVVAYFVYSTLGCRIALPVRYSRSGKDIAILNAELFDQTLANVAFVLEAAERSIIPPA